MPRTNMHALVEFGQSVWLDNISRQLIETGQLQDLIGRGLRGLTSNPTIFEKSVSASNDYDKKINHLHGAGRSTFDIYDEVTVRDIQDAADLFRGVYDETGGLDGYVSLEVDPRLAFKADETVAEARRLWRKVNRQNLMLKVPSTEEGLRAVEELTAAGFNVNITLIFSVGQYRRTAEAYLRGIGRLVADKKDPRPVRSVASVFVSRIDSVVDNQLEGLLSGEKDQGAKKRLLSFKGKAAVANSHRIYEAFSLMRSSKEFMRLQEKGANLQRVLWGSTGTKNPAYSDIKYVTELIARDTVNTIPENTIMAFMDHGTVKEALTADASGTAALIGALRGFGIDVDAVCAKLLIDGIAAFERSFGSLLESIEKKARQLCKA